MAIEARPRRSKRSSPRPTGLRQKDDQTVRPTPGGAQLTPLAGGLECDRPGFGPGRQEAARHASPPHPAGCPAPQDGGTQLERQAWRRETRRRRDGCTTPVRTAPSATSLQPTRQPPPLHLRARQLRQSPKPAGRPWGGRGGERRRLLLDRLRRSACPPTGPRQTADRSWAAQVQRLAGRPDCQVHRPASLARPQITPAISLAFHFVTLGLLYRL